jgi:DNA-binding transcriptional LysR family regulator
MSLAGAGSDRCWPNSRRFIRRSKCIWRFPTRDSGETRRSCRPSLLASRPPPPLLDRWRFRAESGVEEIKVGGQFSSSSGDVVQARALEGRGLSLEALWDVAEDLQAGRLVECLADYWCDSIDLFATFQPGPPARHGSGCSWISSPRQS